MNYNHLYNRHRIDINAKKIRKNVAKASCTFTTACYRSHPDKIRVTQNGPKLKTAMFVPKKHSRFVCEACPGSSSLCPCACFDTHHRKKSFGTAMDLMYCKYVRKT